MMRKLIFMATAILAITACTNPSTTPTSTFNSTEERNVRPDINKNYKKADIDPQLYAKRFTGESREVYVHRDKIVQALNLKSGDRIADIGAGTGIHVKLFADYVGPGGKVYANDISEPFLDYIAQRAETDRLSQVSTVLGTDKSSNLATESVDIIFHSDVYHHFEYPRTMNRDLARALVEGGLLYVLDFERIEGVSADWIVSHVRAGKETAIAEIESSGFEFVEEVWEQASIWKHRFKKL